jgi:hypothetical protein
VSACIDALQQERQESPIDAGTDTDHSLPGHSSGV